MEGNPERILHNGLKKSRYYFRQQGVKNQIDLCVESTNVKTGETLLVVYNVSEIWPQDLTSRHDS